MLVRLLVRRLWSLSVDFRGVTFGNGLGVYSGGAILEYILFSPLFGYYWTGGLGVEDLDCWHFL